MQADCRLLARTEDLKHPSELPEAVVVPLSVPPGCVRSVDQQLLEKMRNLADLKKLSKQASKSRQLA